MSQIIGLTGPIASGKNEVAKILAKLGALVLDVDKEAHKLMGLTRLERKKLAKEVFADKKKLNALNKLVHPNLKKKIAKKLKNRKSANLIVINAAVLKEIGLIECCDEVWVVMATKKTRLARLEEKGLLKKDALARINSQLSHKNYLKLADVVINNDGTKKELNAKVQTLLKI